MSSPFHCVAALGMRLGESPVWEAERQTLRFTDINGKRLHRFDPQSGTLETLDLSEELGCFAPLANGTIIAAQCSGIYHMEPDGGRKLLAANPETFPGSRFNDGSTDPRGRFLAGTIDPERQGRAALYRFDRRGLEQLADGLMTSNGLAFSPDGRTLYHSDTLRYVIHAYDYDLDRGKISNRRVFAQLTPTDADQGRPDGAAVDAEGCYWSALYQGARIHRYAPSGELLASFPVPAQSPTMPCFGGPDLKTLYVTSARDGSSDAQLAAYPLSGGLFAMRVDVPGLAKPFFDPEA
ncbi:SMP-30/gluconolactonase/LRE family protein [Devosia sp.]|uniref:SMP-30/gluconolactonase/LRE family protein n=1 Tax=Devosia sp. TaxID=1871048 RepID=UPI002AFF0375|nr:SMP-30/gluconolactonase/LRE family protein [Devosia sp.]